MKRAYEDLSNRELIALIRSVTRTNAIPAVLEAALVEVIARLDDGTD